MWKLIGEGEAESLAACVLLGQIACVAYGKPPKYCKYRHWYIPWTRDRRILSQTNRGVEATMAFQPNQPMQGKQFQCPPADPIMTDPERVVRDFYHPQKVQVIHPIQVVNRHHCVPVYEHVYTCSEVDEYCGTHPHPHQGMLRK